MDIHEPEKWVSPDRHCDKKFSKEDESSLFYDCLYIQGCSMEESNETISAKIEQLEREIDKLPNNSKEAYFLALDQEIKQRTHYVRNEKFLLLFLRADKFNVHRAAVRMANFFNQKLDLFGPEKLPRRITQGDLNEDDKKVLSSGFIHFGNFDNGGRVVFLIDWDRLRSMGFLNEYYGNSMKRVIFYYGSLVETSEATQRDGMVVIRWNFKSSPTLKDHRFLFVSGQMLALRALPLRLAALHSCFSSPASKLCASLMDSIIRKLSDHFTESHGPNVAACFAGLSKYGIDVDALPLTLNGDFKMEVFHEQLARLRQRERFAKLQKFNDSKQDTERKGRLPSIDASECEEDRNNLKLQAPSLGESPYSHIVEISQLDERDCELIGFSHSTILDLKEEAHRNADEMKPVDVSEGTIEKNQFMKSVPVLNDSSSQNPILSKNDEHLPLKLMGILQRGHDLDAIWWCHGGTTFTMHKDKFPKTILMQEFKGIKMDSFLRQLRRWGFKRMPKTLSTPVNCVEYKHHLFQKNSPELLTKWGNFTREGSSSCVPPTCQPPVEVIHSEVSPQNPLLLEHSTLKSLVKRELGDGHLPLKLMGILEKNAVPDAIFWIRDGTAFAIEKDKFSKTILPQEFNGIKMGSFLRGLRRWGFQRLPMCKSALNCVLFKHEQFQKNSPQLLIDWGKETKKDKFPTRLFNILESNSASDSIWWVDNGRAFAINPKKFGFDVLEEHFAGLKFASFQRYLSRWDFKQMKRHTYGPELMVFRHPSFRKNSPELLDELLKLNN